MLRSSGIIFIVAIFVVAGHKASSALAQTQLDLEASNISGSLDAPRRHARIKNSIALTDAEAERIYALVKDALAAGYASTGDAILKNYQSMKKYNATPYRSASHGNQYLNNYANGLGENYGRYENAGTFAQGAVLYKDSFSVAENKQIVLGPLFIMIKMQPGFNPVSGDWRYVQVQPTGEVLGETNAMNSEKVDFCIDCHITRESQDHLFFFPQEYRVR